MNNKYTISTPQGGVALANDNAFHCILEVTAPATMRVALQSLLFGASGTNSNDNTVEFMLAVLTSSGAGGSAVTATKTNGSPVAVQSTAQRGVFTTEPTTGSTIFTGTCHPQLNFGDVFPISREIMIEAGTSVGLFCRIPAANQPNNIKASLFLEE